MKLLDEFISIGKTRGLDLEAAFSPEPKVPIIECLTSFRYEQQGRRLLTCSEAKQKEDFAEALENPFKTKLSIVSSRPSDLASRQLAIMLFQTAVLDWLDLPYEKRKGKSQPLWHRVWGTNYDSLRDSKSKEKTPSFLVISNVAQNSTREKIEKVRDLLVMYESVPKVLVVSGDRNPAEFAMEKLFLPVNSFYYITPHSKKREA